MTRRNVILLILLAMSVLSAPGCGRKDHDSGAGTADSASTATPGAATDTTTGSASDATTGTATDTATSAGTGTNAQPMISLARSRQGQSIGLADVDGDGIADKIVGAPYAAATSGQTGAVLVYKGNAPGGFNTSPDMVLTGDDNLGFTFAHIGSDFAIGAIHGDGADASLSGSVTIYKSGGNGQIVRKLAGERPMDKFGYSLAAGDLNGDGVSDIIVGAPMNTNIPTLYQSGAVYVFFGPDDTTGVSLYASSKNKGLGSSVAAGDLDGDGIDDLLLAASGKVLVYFGKAGFNPTIDSPDITIACSSSGFGKSIAVIGDVNGVPGGEIAIGAPTAARTLGGVPSRDVGSVYIISKPSGTALTIDDSAISAGPLIVRIDGETLFSRFGSTITALGNGDFAVGAPLVDNAGYLLSGKVYSFKGNSISIAPPTTVANAVAFAGKVKDQGYGLALAGATNGMLLIGGPHAEYDAGSVNLVDLLTGQPVIGGGTGGASGSGGSGGGSDCCY